MREIILVNDILHGSMGERVIWNYMLEKIPNIYGVPISNIKEIDKFSKDAIIIQNATFIPKVDNTRFTICYLQDNIIAMSKKQHHINNQLNTLNNCQHIVFNSKEIKKSYSQYSGTVIPIGIDEELFNIKDQCSLRQKYNIPNKKVGIFIGNFTETKGWEDVKSIISLNPDIYFILVTKNSESYSTENSSTFSRVKQEVLSELINCADFFILGSPVETQCLAALEAGFCGKPIIMKNTGIFMDWEDRDHVGVFNNNLFEGIKIYLQSNKTYDTRNFLMLKDLSIKSMIDKWISLLESIV